MKYYRSMKMVNTTISYCATNHNVPQSDGETQRQPEPSSPNQNAIDKIRQPTNVKGQVDDQKFKLDRIQQTPFPRSELAGVPYDYILHVFRWVRVQIRVDDHHDGDWYVSG